MSRYHIPEHLAEHVDYITPGIKLTPVVKRNVKRGANQRHGRPQSPGKSPLDQNPFRHDFAWGFQPATAADLPDNLRNCGRNITADCYRALYDVPMPTTATPGNSLGLYEQGDYFAKADLDMYYAAFAPYVPEGTYPTPALINGAQYDFPQNATQWVGGEADIDIDIA